MFGLTSPAVLLGGGLVLAAGGFYFGYDYRDARCDAAALQAKVDDLERQLRTTKLAAENAEEASEELERENAIAKKLLDDIRADPSACIRTYEQSCRLRKLAGLGCPPVPALPADIHEPGEGGNPH